MTISELSHYLDRLEGTASRNDLVRILAKLYQKSSPDEIQPLTYLVQGRLVPFFEPVEIGMDEKLRIGRPTVTEGVSGVGAEMAAASVPPSSHQWKTAGICPRTTPVLDWSLGWLAERPRSSFSGR